MMQTFLLIGGSRGIGLAAAEHFIRQGHELFCVSRGRSPYGTWIDADVSTDAGLDRIASILGDRPIDALLYLGGTWEKGAFTDEYDFGRSPRDETRNVIAVNLVAPILITQLLTPNLIRAPNPRVILMGALSGRDGAASVEVANTASKFGLRGAAQALSRALRAQRIGVTVINPGNIATPEVESDIEAGRFGEQEPIPMVDLLATLDFSLGLSPAATPREIDLEQRNAG